MIGDFNEQSSFQINLETLLNMKQHETMAKLNCMRIGIIQEILEDNTVICSITNKKTLKTNHNGTQEVIEYPPIYAKVYYIGTGDFAINYPLAVGSPCLLLFNDREFYSFFQTGEISPLDTYRMHDLSDCICMPLSLQQHNENFRINNVNGVIEINGDTVNISADTVNINADIINLNTPNLYINGKPYKAHSHSNGNQGANTGGVVDP